MNHEYTAAYIAFACIAWLSVCSCSGNGIELTALIDILAGCKSSCLFSYCPSFGFNWGCDSWWQKRWRSWGLAAGSCGSWITGWHFPWMFGHTETIEEPIVFNPPIFLPSLAPVLLTGRYVISLLLACFIIFASNIVAKKLNEQGEEF